MSERGRVKWRRGTVLKVTLRVDTEQETMFDVAVSRKLNPLKTAIEGPTHYAKIMNFCLVAVRTTQKLSASKVT